MQASLLFLGLEVVQCGLMLPKEIILFSLNLSKKYLYLTAFREAFIVFLSFCLQLFIQALILLPQLQVDVYLRGKHFFQIFSTKLVCPLCLLALVAVD
jgi:hypothetical protein